jgi:hypothetical protein
LLNKSSCLSPTLGFTQFLITSGKNGTAHFEKCNSHWNTNIYSYLETSGGLSSNLYLNVVQFFYTSVN